jgi:hypothetical protein
MSVVVNQKYEWAKLMMKKGSATLNQNYKSDMEKTLHYSLCRVNAAWRDFSCILGKSIGEDIYKLRCFIWL